MTLKIAFLGWDARLTARYLEQLAMDNVERVSRYNPDRGFLALKDGTEIIIPRIIGLNCLDGRRFDQVILADDRRMKIKEHPRHAIAVLLNSCSRSIVPEEFRLQIYDIDAEAPARNPKPVAGRTAQRKEGQE